MKKIQIGDIYTSKRQPVASIPGIRNYWGIVTDLAKDGDFVLIEVDYGIAKGSPENIFTDILSRKEYNELKPIPAKECSHCHKIKPYDEFYISTHTSSGRQSWCKECTKKDGQTRIRKKKCPQCGEIKSSSEFYKAKSRSDGLSSYCKECDREHGRLHRKATANKPDTYLSPDKKLREATEKELISRLKALGTYKIIKLETIETEL